MQPHIGPNGLILEIDEDDPATPAMVRSPGKQFASTYDCAVAIGALEDEYELSPAQLTWLDKYAEQVDNAFEAARIGPEWEDNRV